MMKPSMPDRDFPFICMKPHSLDEMCKTTGMMIRFLKPKYGIVSFSDVRDGAGWRFRVMTYAREGYVGGWRFDKENNPIDPYPDARN